MIRLWFKYDPAYTKIYSQKRGYSKGAFQEEVKEEVKEELKKEKDVRGAESTSTERGTRPEAPFVPPGLTKQKPSKPTTNLTNDIVNQ